MSDKKQKRQWEMKELLKWIIKIVINYVCDSIFYLEKITRNLTFSYFLEKSLTSHSSWVTFNISFVFSTQN